MAAPDLLHWNVEQPGSTGLCKVSYPIDESKLPSIYAVPIKVMSGPKGIRIKSQRLRSQAIKQFKETHLSEFDKISAVQYCAKKDEEDQDDKLPLDCLLFLISKGVTRKVSQAIKDLKHEEKTVTVVKRVKYNDGNYQSQYIHCALKPVSHVPYGSDSADYWKKLDILIRTFIRNVTIDGTTFTKSTELLLEPTFPFRFPESQEDTESHETNEIVTATAIPNAQKVSTLSRIRPKLDPILKELHFELDLVPGIEKDVLLSDLVFGIFGRALTGPRIHHHLKDIRSMLTGLVVDRTYQPERPSQSLSSDVTSWCVIRDVQLAGEIPSFIRNGQRYSVAKYFKEVIQRDIHYTTLPLAKIGKNAWVPLETLKAHHTQTLHSSTLTEGLFGFLKSRAPSNEMLEKLKRKTSSIIDGVIADAQCPMFVKFDKQEDPSFFPGVTRQTSVSETNVGRETIQVADGLALSIGIIYISPEISRVENDDDFVTEVYERIRKSGNNIDETFNSSEPLTATISDIQPLLLTDSEERQDVRTFCNRRPNTVLAIIDTNGRTKSALRDIRAEWHKFGNRKLGAVTYCITRKSLEKLFNDNKSNPNYFPRGILWRLNSMHGGQNFKIEPAQTSPQGTGLMVVGAHISHPGPDAAQSCPSVASVVSNLDQKLTVFPGSVRLHHDPHTEPVVFRLREMMIERCKAWKDKNKGLAPRVVFYRGGLDIFKKDVIDTVVKHEMEIIAGAIKSEFAGQEKPHLTYVVANKHHIKSTTYGSNKKKILESNQIETSRTDESSRYTYYVMRNNDDQMNVEDITSLLTTNYQPDHVAKPAIAVPIHYARKLALRTYDYFRFAVTNKYDTFSGALRQQAKHHPANNQQAAYLLGEYRPSEGSVTDVSDRSNPWPEEFDEKMFYL